MIKGLEVFSLGSNSKTDARFRVEAPFGMLQCSKVSELLRFTSCV
jgi:hypothetical protein